MDPAALRYAQVLFELAQEQHNFKAVQAALTDIRSLILNVQIFRRFLGNPLLTFEERSKILKALFEGKIPEIVFRFLLFITCKSRLNILKEIIEAFDNLYLAHTHQLRAYVKTAFPVNEDDKSFINLHLQNKFRHQMITRWDFDPGLIGGFRINVQGQIYDYSFKSQLNHFFQLAAQPA